MKPHSKEFRGEVLAACDRGRSTRKVATHFNGSESWVRRVKQERRELNKAITAAGARLVYLPPYSPDLNPIELVFSKFKWLLKSASARTVEALWSVCGDALGRFTEAECRNCFKHCGYRYT